MLAQQRYKTILDLLEEHGIVHSADLVREMKVSSETVRKDLDALEQSGKLKRVHGGAVPISQMSAQPFKRAMTGLTASISLAR